MGLGGVGVAEDLPKQDLARAVLFTRDSWDHKTTYTVNPASVSIRRRIHHSTVCSASALRCVALRGVAWCAVIGDFHNRIGLISIVTAVTHFHAPHLALYPAAFRMGWLTLFISLLLLGLILVERPSKWSSREGCVPPSYNLFAVFGCFGVRPLFVAVVVVVDLQWTLPLNS